MTVTIVATPSTRRTAASVAPARLMRAMSRVPSEMTAASDMAAPSAKVRKSSAARGAAEAADAAMSTPRIGPAHGAHKSQIAIPTTTLRSGVAAPSSRDPLRHARRQQRDADDREQDERDIPSNHVRNHQPVRGRGRDEHRRGERERETGEHRRDLARKAASRPSEDQWNDGENARAHDREHPSQKRQHEYRHPPLRIQLPEV